MTTVQLCLPVNSTTSCDGQMMPSHDVSLAAPNRLVDWRDLKDTLGEQISTCKECGSTNRELVHGKGRGSQVIATCVYLQCNNCTAIVTKATDKVKY